MTQTTKDSKKRTIDIRYNLSIYFSFLKRYKLLFILSLLTILFLESSQVVDKYLFKLIIDRSTQVEGNSLLATNFMQFLLSLALIYLVLICSKAVANWLRHHFINVLEARMIFDVKRRFFDHILYLSHRFHTTHKTGSLISRLIRGGGSIERMTDVLVFNIAPLLFQLGVVSLSLLYFNWISALVVFITIILFIGYGFLVQFYQQPKHQLTNMAEDREKAYISDVFTNIDSIKYFGKEKTITERFRHLGTKSKEALLKAWNYWRWLDSGQTLIIGLGTFFLLYFSLKDFLRGNITVGTLAFIYMIYGNLMPAMYSFVHGMRQFYRAMIDFEDLFQYGKTTNDIHDKAHAKKLSITEGKIEFRHVTFKYHKNTVLQDFTLTIHPHQKVALVGHSGSGKSTIIKLLYRLYDLDEGVILIDGKDIRDVQQESLRSELSIVPQECVLFDDTIYNNIAFSRSEASSKEVWKAIRFAQLDKTIQIFPEKEQTIVGERGVKLSGGEKQRVSFARALLANKNVLILDEATSSLDSQTEHEIQQDLKQLMKGRTVIIIAHRLSTIMRADKIVVMDKGKIIQLGTHEQLIRHKGKYRTLWRLQQGGYIK
ncbi:ABC transporter ATP-binding protein [Candidatus Woesearchaeota archaeon]|nr:ABC transporter ATP-binding protein [Candidatus Woesearchaeota archaeon]